MSRMIRVRVPGFVIEPEFYTLIGARMRGVREGRDIGATLVSAYCWSDSRVLPAPFPCSQRLLADVYRFGLPVD